MIIPYSFRRKKFVLATIALLLILIFLINHSPVSIETISAKDPHISGFNFFAKLEQGSSDWSIKFHEINWFTDVFFFLSHYVPFLRKEGNDVIESVIKLKYFQKCLAENYDTELQRMNDIQEHLFPYLHFDAFGSSDSKFWPTYTRWNGAVYENSLPRFSPVNNTFLDAPEVKYNYKRFFWANWLENYVQPGSKGIVVSAGDNQCSDTVRLIRVLRYLKNTLPIEIVHKGDLSQVYQEMLVKAARDDDSDTYPSQEMWFSDISHMIASNYAAKFSGYSNKWLAVLFSSFENTILVDADTVPFVGLEHYYEWEQFKNFGAVFFKDRGLKSDPLNKWEVARLKAIADKLLSLDLKNALSSNDLRHQLSLRVKDTIALNTIESIFMHGYKHHMESGLVVINKNKNLMGLLTSLSLHFSSVREYFHGDKEWFWIAQFLRNESFTFHPKEASNIGRLGNVASEDSSDFYQICSVQLSHSDIDGSILWVNGGMKTCKKNSWNFDYDRSKRLASMYSSSEELREYYETPVHLEGAIIPDLSLTDWVNSGECAAYNYCTLYKEGQFGELLRFNDSTKEAYNEIVRIWNLPI
ncbi:hypothetical protein HG535_0G03180 [Zygotorulaspora mrakii]|uniref:Alpha-1,3-mannosyltransferase n=1 Tax=Zygotorulaspora mrakii TaxID=42260 RepID=A0A7H9B6T2_ZYGMR|nr:uncharacterized protein HG535_0G03180 [Zygotorulaspora mrakii]QLG74435.1 hypothetical protein HG535_0G03180 [Zygotorulaspora mrakii]